jgi:RHS repeat-associated protein
MQVLPRTTEPLASPALAAAGESGTILYDGQDILRETRSDGTTTTTYTYIHGPGIDEPLARIDQAGSVTYYHADGLGSIVKMTDSAGTVVQTRQYDAWGNLEVGADQSGYAFTGREWDPEIGLYYYRARYYDPKIGRFISEDPIGFAGGVNFYGYVFGDPIGLVDPTGLEGTGEVREVVEGVGRVGLLDALTARRIAQEVWATSTRPQPDTKAPLPGPGGGAQDAFRHCLIQCRLASEINQQDARDAGDVHEEANLRQGGSLAEYRMDEYNNTRGRGCALAGAGGRGGRSCESACMGELRAGRLAGLGGTPRFFDGVRRSGVNRGW